MRQSAALAFALIFTTAVAQDSSIKNPSDALAIKPRPEGAGKAEDKPYAAKPRPDGSEKAQMRGIFESAVGQPDSPHEKAATIKSLERLYGTDRNITYVKAHSGRGDIGSGVVVDRTADRITLDTTPCVDQDKRLLTFVAPYKESKIDEERCPRKTYPRSQVIQLGR
jgi:hypothetical protein